MTPAIIAALIGGAASLGSAALSARASKKAAAAQVTSEKENRALAERTAATNVTDFDTAMDAALARLGEGNTVATGGYDAATGYQTPYNEAGTRSLTEYMNALGLNGAEGSAGALSRFQTSPGYQWQMDQGVAARDRSANARGNLYSGGQLRSLTEYGQGLANQEWQLRLSQLAGLGQMGQQSGNMLSQLAVNRGTTAGNYAGAQADVLLGNAANKASTRWGGATMAGNANSNIGSAQAAGITNAASSWNAGLTNLSQIIARAAASRAPLTGTA